MSEDKDNQILTKRTFRAYEKDHDAFMHRGPSIQIKHLKRMTKIFGKSVNHIVQLNEDIAHNALLAGVRLQAVQTGFLPLTRKDRKDGHYLANCRSCGYWGTSRIFLTIKNDHHCPICHSIKIGRFNVGAEINRLQNF